MIQACWWLVPAYCMYVHGMVWRNVEPPLLRMLQPQVLRPGAVYANTRP